MITCSPAREAEALHALRGTLWVMLGSFDPVHRAHQWLVDQALARGEAALLLIPALHFEKRVRFPHNATFSMRLAMLRQVFSPRRGPVHLGVTEEVLFVRLLGEVQALAPAARVRFVMGRDTWDKARDSEAYFRRLGLRWGEEQVTALERVLGEALVFDRRAMGQGLAVPGMLRRISSTLVRRTARVLHRRGAPAKEWRSAMEGMVHGPTVRFIREHGLYGEGAAQLPSSPPGPDAGAYNGTPTP